MIVEKETPIKKLSIEESMERDILLSTHALYEGMSFNESSAYKFMTITNTSINLELEDVAWADAKGLTTLIPIEKAKEICKEFLVTIGSLYLTGKSDLPERIDELKKLRGVDKESEESVVIEDDGDEVVDTVEPHEINVPQHVDPTLESPEVLEDEEVNTITDTADTKEKDPVDEAAPKAKKDSD